MRAMQVQENILAVFDTDVPLKARKYTGLGCSSAPMATGRKHLGRFSAPIGGATRLAGNNPVIWTIQIVTGPMEVFRRRSSSLFRKTDYDSSPGGDSFLVDVNTHIGEW